MSSHSSTVVKASDFPYKRYLNRECYRWIRDKKWSDTYKQRVIYYKERFGVWFWDYTRRMELAQIQWIKDTVEKHFPSLELKLNPAWCNGVDILGLTKGICRKKAMAFECWNEKYCYNHRPKDRLNWVINNLLKEHCKGLFVVSCLQRLFREKARKECEKHSIAFIHLGVCKTPFYDFYTPEEIAEYRLVKTYPKEAERLLLSAIEDTIAYVYTTTSEG